MQPASSIKSNTQLQGDWSEINPRSAGKRDRELQITSLVLVIISLVFCIVGFTCMGIGNMPSMLRSGMGSFAYYFVGAHVLFIGLGLMISSVVFSVLSACQCHERCASSRLSSQAFQSRAMIV